MQIYIHRRSKVQDCGCGGRTGDSPSEELKALENEMKEMELKFDAGEISKEKWQEFRRSFVKERHRLTELMRLPESGRLEYQSAGTRRRGDARTLDPPKSEAQRRAMWAAAEGRSNLGIPKEVGKEFVGSGSKDRGDGKTFDDAAHVATIAAYPIKDELGGGFRGVFLIRKTREKRQSGVLKTLSEAIYWAKSQAHDAYSSVGYKLAPLSRSGEYQANVWANV